MKQPPGCVVQGGEYGVQAQEATYGLKQNLEA